MMCDLFCLGLDRQCTADTLLEGGQRLGVSHTTDRLNARVEQVEQMLIILGVELDKHGIGAQRELRLDHFGDLLQLLAHLVVHRALLQAQTDIDAELVAQLLGVDLVGRTNDDTIVKHLLHTLVNSCAADATSVGHVLERGTCILGDNLQYPAIQLVNFLHDNSFLLQFGCKVTTFFGYMQVFLYFCSRFCRNMTLNEYIEQMSSPENEALAFITRDTNTHVLNPHMLSGQVQGRVLSMLSRMIRPRRILELGTFTGYSALCLAEGLVEDGRLITIEHNDELEETIRRNLSLSPLNEKIELVIGDAQEELSAMSRQQSEEFDLVFIDADKRQYSAYLDLVYPLVKVGGWILADNVLWDGHILDPAYDRDKQTQGLRAFNEKVRKDDRLDKVILPLRDGLTLIQKVR